MTASQIKRWIRDGRLHPLFPAVFAVGHQALGPRGRVRAAALACPGSVVSHRSAATLLGFGRAAPLVVDLIPNRQRGRGIGGVKAHLVPYPRRSEWAYLDGIPCTIPARTIVDLAGTYGDKQLRDAVERAATERLLALDAIDAILTAGPKRRGAPCLRRVLAPWRPVAEVVKHATIRSLFEARLLPLIAAAGLPTPRPNAPVPTANRTLEVDLLWPDHRFIVEADSRRHHALEAAFDRDHLRYRELIAAEYRVLPVTWREVEDEPTAVLSVIREELAKPSSPRPQPARRSAAPLCPPKCQ